MTPELPGYISSPTHLENIEGSGVVRRVTLLDPNAPHQIRLNMMAGKKRVMLTELIISCTCGVTSAGNKLKPTMSDANMWYVYRNLHEQREQLVQQIRAEITRETDNDINEVQPRSG